MPVSSGIAARAIDCLRGASVHYRRPSWEIYLASQFTKDGNAWTTTAPHLEVNYGGFQNVQLQATLPMILNVPARGPSSYGYGDTQIGIKYKFIREGDLIPSVATYPQMMLPTGSRAMN